MDSYIWGLGFYFVPSFDFSSYSLKDWLQIVAAVIGIGGSTYGAWTAFRYSKSQIAKRLAEYLNDHEKNVDEARQLIVQHLRNDRPMDRKPETEIHQRIESAIRLVARGHKEDAERELERFALVLSHSSEVGRRHADLAKKQAATILVFAGLIAQKRGETGPARSAWLKALDHNPQDVEAIRGLGELALAEGREPEARKLFEKAQDHAQEDKRLRAETESLKANHYRAHRSPRRELRALRESAPRFEEISEHQLAGQAFERAAELEGNTRSRLTLIRAYHAYHRAGDRAGVDRVLERLRALGVDVTTLPALGNPSRWPQIPWPWTRLSFEVLILGAAVYVMFMR